MFGLLKADTLAMVVADLQEAVDEGMALSYQCPELGQAIAVLVSLVGWEKAGEKIAKAKAR